MATQQGIKQQQQEKCTPYILQTELQNTDGAVSLFLRVRQKRANKFTDIIDNAYEHLTAFTGKITSLDNYQHLTQYFYDLKDLQSYLNDKDNYLIDFNSHLFKILAKVNSKKTKTIQLAQIQLVPTEHNLPQKIDAMAKKCLQLKSRPQQSIHKKQFVQILANFTQIIEALSRQNTKLSNCLQKYEQQRKKQYANQVKIYSGLYFQITETKQKIEQIDGRLKGRHIQDLNQTIVDINLPKGSRIIGNLVEEQTIPCYENGQKAILDAQEQRLNASFVQPNKSERKDNYIPIRLINPRDWLDKRCLKAKQIVVNGSSKVITCKQSCYLMSKKVICIQDSYSVQIIKIKEYIGLGLVDRTFILNCAHAMSNDWFRKLSNHYILWNSGDMWYQGNRNIRMGLKTKQSQVIKVEINLQKGTIRWIMPINGQIKCSVISPKLTKDIEWVPFICLGENGDSIRILEN